MAEKESLEKVSKSELLDLLENTGILQEANRTFFHPIGLNLKLEEDLSLTLERSIDDHGAVLHTVDKFKINAFNHYRLDKHKNRQEIVGFVIQTQDMIRANKLDTPIVSPSILKLNALLVELDNFAFEIKRRLMQVSPDKDVKFDDLDEEELMYKMQTDFQTGNFIDGAARAMMISHIERINLKLKDLRKLDKQQKKVYKEEK